MWQALGNLVEKEKKKPLVNNVGWLIMENEWLGPAQIASGSLPRLNGTSRHSGEVRLWSKYFLKRCDIFCFFNYFFFRHAAKCLPACIMTRNAARLIVSSTSFEWRNETWILLNLISKNISSYIRLLEIWQKLFFFSSFSCISAHFRLSPVPSRITWCIGSGSGCVLAER